MKVVCNGKKVIGGWFNYLIWWDCFQCWSIVLILRKKEID